MQIIKQNKKRTESLLLSHKHKSPELNFKLNND
jgi:hypothetical protein